MAEKNTKLGQALHDAALENINEDIHSIVELLAKIKEEAPDKASSLIDALRKDVSALDKALQTVPDNFDIAFKSKMNDLLDAASEITKHTQDLERKIKGDISESIEKQSEAYAKKFNSKIKGYKIVTTLSLIIYGILTASIGGAIAGFLVWNIFPKIF